jgi:hypothetical protein
MPAENPQLTSCLIAPCVIAGSPFRPPSYQLTKSLANRPGPPMNWTARVSRFAGVFMPELSQGASQTPVPAAKINRPAERRKNRATEPVVTELSFCRQPLCVVTCSRFPERFQHETPGSHLDRD